MKPSGLLIFGLPTIIGSTRALSIRPESNVTALLTSKYLLTCKAIAKSVTGVYYPGDPLYLKGNSHWSSASDQNSTCVVEPANTHDVSTIIKLVGQTRTPFGIRSGGHATNPGFSSTPGVQIALFKLSQVTYHAAPFAADGSVGTVEIGPGLIWDDVYAALEPHNVIVVGGRVTGIGVGGFILGGGYSFLSNQYGLAIDNVVAFEVVLPSGMITTATQYLNPDLFFGLKGGFNNFGVVTKFTLLAYPQTKVWGGTATFGQDQLSAVNQATVDFIASVTDPKAAVLPATFTTKINGTLSTLIALSLFYDNPTPPTGIFERFTSIPSVSSDVSIRSMNSLVRSSPSNGTYGLRSSFTTVSLKTYTIPLLELIQNQSMYWGEKTTQRGGFFVSYAVEPFLPSMSKKSKGGAYPDENFLTPLNLHWSWSSSLDDKFFTDSARASAQGVMDQAIAEGQDIAGSKQIRYGNYADANEDLRRIYGTNLDRLRRIRKKYDLDNIMSLAGGFRF